MVATIVPLFCLLPKEEPVDKQGKIDFIGIVLGLSGLILFSFAWKYGILLPYSPKTFRNC